MNTTCSTLFPNVDCALIPAPIADLLPGIILLAILALFTIGILTAHISTLRRRIRHLEEECDDMDLEIGQLRGYNESLKDILDDHAIPHI